MEAHGGLKKKTIHGDIGIAQQQQRTKEKTIIKIEVERK